jgi:hypothetical protein
MKSLALLIATSTFAVTALAKLPAPTEEAKAKAAEAAAKTAHAGKADAYQLCKAQDRVAAHYYKTAKAAKKDTKPPVSTAACADPGPFVYTPPGGAPAAAPVPAVPAAAKKKS